MQPLQNKTKAMSLWNADMKKLRDAQKPVVGRLVRVPASGKPMATRNAATASQPEMRNGFQCWIRRVLSRRMTSPFTRAVYQHR